MPRLRGVLFAILGIKIVASSAVSIKLIAGVVNVTGYAENGQNLLNTPLGIAKIEGGLVFSDSSNNRIRVVRSRDGDVLTFAGGGSYAFRNDANALGASFARPAGLALGENGVIYVADSANNRIRVISPITGVGTFAGSGNYSFKNANTSLGASFASPTGICYDASTRTMYVADKDNHVIRKINSSGYVTTVAGIPGIQGFTNGNSLQEARFYLPYDVKIDAAKNLYVSDSGNHAIRKISREGNITTVTTVAGTGYPGNNDGNGANATFRTPRGMDLEPGGNIYVADSANGVVRYIDTTSNVVSTLSPPANMSFHGAVSALAYIGNGDGFGFQTIWVGDQSTIRELKTFFPSPPPPSPPTPLSPPPSSPPPPRPPPPRPPPPSPPPPRPPPPSPPPRPSPPPPPRPSPPPPPRTSPPPPNQPPPRRFYLAGKQPTASSQQNVGNNPWFITVMVIIAAVVFSLSVAIAVYAVRRKRRLASE